MLGTQLQARYGDPKLKPWLDGTLPEEDLIQASAARPKLEVYNADPCKRLARLRTIGPCKTLVTVGEDVGSDGFPISRVRGVLTRAGR